jgi:hypothetical protein
MDAPRATWLVLVLSVACSIDEGPTIAADTAALTGQNLNGPSLNGQNLNGPDLDGSSLGAAIAWVELAGARRHGVAVTDLGLVGSELRGRIGGATVGGTSLVDLTLVAASDTGATLALRVAGVTPPAAGDDRWRYRVEYEETDGSWQPICRHPTTGAALGAVPLAGYWNREAGVAGGGEKIPDPDVVTFACEQIGALGKCVGFGYRPWATAGGVGLERHHQTCVRAIRNDYCGDGTPHTVDGNLINLYDDLGVLDDETAWLSEAEWDEDGARCINVLNNRRLLALPCRLSLESLLCGAKSHFASGTLLITEKPLLELF